MKVYELVAPLESRIELIGLQSQAYNGQYGILKGFSESSKRYVIELESTGKKIKVQGKNIIPLLGHNSTFPKLWKQVDVCDTISEARDLLDVLEMIKCELSPIEFVYLSKTLCVNIMDNTRDRTLLEEVEQRLEGLLCVSVSERALCTTKIALARCYGMLERSNEKAVAILQKLRVRHYGNLPNVLRMLARVSTGNSYEETMSIYNEFQKALATGNYPIPETPPDENFGDDLRMIAIGSICMNSDCDVELAESILADMRSESYIDDALGMINTKKNNFEGALENFTRRQESLTAEAGIEHATGEMMRRAACFLAVGDVKQAEKCVKQIKKSGTVRMEDLKGLEDTIRLYKSVHGKGKSSKFKCKTRAKCSNPFCRKVEKKVAEFQVCSNCSLAKYCSRKCQRKHWKHGHKKQCKNHFGTESHN